MLHISRARVSTVGSANEQRVKFGTSALANLANRATGRLAKAINGTEAAKIRLIDKAVPADQLMAAAREVAKAMGENPQGALQTVKQLITENMSESDLREVQKRELAALEICYKSVEHKEAINAFIEKRDPDFREARKR